MRTKQEVIDFLESKVGGGVPHPGKPELDSQCVTLIKALMEFLGVPNPYKARGHAKTAISAYLNEGIADPGTGFISVFSNKFMGGGYGHIWCNVGDGIGTYYESNGVKPLIVTKGEVYSYDAVCNFDKYIAENNGSNEPEKEKDMLLEYLGANNEQEAKKRLAEHLGEKDGKCNWGAEGQMGGFLGSAREKLNNPPPTQTVKQGELPETLQFSDTMLIIDTATTDKDGNVTGATYKK